MCGLYILLLVVLLQNCLGLCLGRKIPEYDHGLGLNTTKPLNIAHRGSGGAFPEHVIPGFIHAYESGADLIELDIAVTKDLQLVCLHDAYMTYMTDVEDVFPEDRKNTYEISGQNRTDYFTVDFTLDELRTLTLIQRDRERDPNYNYQYGITSLEEVIQIAQSWPTTVGIAPEIKIPSWYNSLDILRDAGTTVEELLVDLLASYGYADRNDPILVLSFEEASVRSVAGISDLAVSFLTREQLTPERLADLATFCYGVALEKRAIIEADVNNYRIGVTPVVENARQAGLRVSVWTLKTEHEYLLWDYIMDPYKEYEDFVVNALVDAVITDFPLSFQSYLKFLDCED